MTLEYGKLKISRTTLKRILIGLFGIVFVFMFFALLILNFRCDKDGPRLEPSDNIKINVEKKHD